VTADTAVGSRSRGWMIQCGGVEGAAPSAPFFGFRGRKNS
jgi:hypothetical protein